MNLVSGALNLGSKALNLGGRVAGNMLGFAGSAAPSFALWPYGEDLGNKVMSPIYGSPKEIENKSFNSGLEKGYGMHDRSLSNAMSGGGAATAAAGAGLGLYFMNNQANKADRQKKIIAAIKRRKEMYKYSSDNSLTKQAYANGFSEYMEKNAMPGLVSSGLTLGSLAAKYGPAAWTAAKAGLGAWGLYDAGSAALNYGKKKMIKSEGQKLLDSSGIMDKVNDWDKRIKSFSNYAPMMGAGAIAAPFLAQSMGGKSGGGQNTAMLGKLNQNVQKLTRSVNQSQTYSPQAYMQGQYTPKQYNYKTV